MNYLVPKDQLANAWAALRLIGYHKSVTSCSVAVGVGDQGLCGHVLLHIRCSGMIGEGRQLLELYGQLGR